MSLINIISVPTSSGIKTIEIHNADIAKLDFDVDILVLSAYHNKYFPAPNTVIKALADYTGVVLGDLANNPGIDLRQSLHCWVSNEIIDKPFKRILCIEGIKSSIEKEGTSDSALSDLFGTISLLKYKKISMSKIAMPILGSGFQKNSIEVILPQLIENAISSLQENSTLKSIYFVEINPDKANLIDDTVNKFLERGKDKLEIVLEDPKIDDTLDQILSKLMQIRNNYSFYKNKTIRLLIGKISTKSLRFFELGILTRKLLELLLSDLAEIESDEKYTSTFEYISNLKAMGVSDWMITYLHTLRVFGNFVAHENEAQLIPKQMGDTEILVFTHALNRFLDLYIKMKEKVT